MTVTLKRLAETDMDRAAAVHRHSFDAALPWLTGLHTQDEDRAFFRERVFVDCEIWGAFDPALVGIVAFRAGWIDQLYVRPDRQNEGVGSALLEVAKSASPTLLLWTFQRNAPARRFYEKHGFVAIDETDGSGNEEREPDVLYRWQRT